MESTDPCCPGHRVDLGMPELGEILPSSLRPHARWERLGASRVPALLVHPAWSDSAEAPPPLVLWFHGRTVNKELDPGRYLRWMRAGIAACAIDLPGHGERFEQRLQGPETAWEVIHQMVEEFDEVVDALRKFDAFDLSRLGIGGMSLGGMVALARLTRDHPCRCAGVEATTGMWADDSTRAQFEHRVPATIRQLEPIRNLDRWREIPLQAIHARGDEWVKYERQAAFLDVLRARYRNPGLIETIIYEHTGAPYEHIGFGRKAADAKQKQTAFFAQWLGVTEKSTDGHG